MAIKVGGTTVVSDARAISNVISITGLTTALSPGQGGTGLSAVGTTGNILVSNGSIWTSAAPAASGGSGLFNTSITSATGYAVTSSMATAYTASATAGKRYIVHSIQVANINGTASADISGQFSGTTYSSTAFAFLVPIPAGSAVELLKKPKILQPSDLIQLQASLDSYLHATIIIEEVSGTAHFGVGVDITSATTYTDLHIATGNSVLESILLANDDGSNDVKARVIWADGSDTIQGYFVYDLIVPADSTIEIFEQPKYLPSGHKIRVYANQANRLESTISGKLTGT